MNNVRLSLNLKQAMIKHGFSVKPLSKKSLYEVGKTYWCGYWQKFYKVLDVKYDNSYNFPILKSVTIEWQDGSIVTHCTNLDIAKDFEIIL